MEISVLIPTYRRPAKLAACLKALAGQGLPPGTYEVLVGIDGPDGESEAAARRVWGEAGGAPGALVVKQCPRSGLNAVRNMMLEGASGRLMVSLNDDVVPGAGFLAAHLGAHVSAEQAGKGPVVVSGYSPWKRWANPTIFDRLVSDSSMIFFYDQMGREVAEQKGPWHDWGFRHCYGLNFSAPLGLVRESGKFTAFHLAYGYDDIELAFRLNRKYGTKVLYRPEAEAEHDHRYTAPEVLAREFKLGHAAWHFAGHDPAFCEALFGRDVRSREELVYSKEFLHRERRTAASVRETFLKLDSMPGSDLAGPAEKDVLRMIYLHHLPLKRWMWRAGLVSASQDRGCDEVVYPE